MLLEVTFRNMRGRDEVRRRAQALFDKLERFVDPTAHGHLVVTLEHGSTCLELTVSCTLGVHQVEEEDADLRTALDRAFHTMEKTLRRAKEKQVDRWHRGPEKADGFVADLGDELEEDRAPAT
ncbi:MAG: ribosome-associated translation inhibitor RaiA [Alphaproteobacteria bacterium]|nr:ribosome-associated translation inhibitor RaiA [Alphaproteobacteria bacterium]